MGKDENTAAAKKRFGTVAIVGVGLIGGSIGLALRERKLADAVIGIGRRQASLDIASEVGAVTETTTDAAQGVANADLVVICTPVGKVVEFVRAVAKALPEGSIITDAASTKASIVSALEQEVANGLPFVGSHPIAGSHLTGAAAAKADLFVDRNVIITPTSSSDPAIVNTISEFWSELGAETHAMSGDEHDQILAATSHVPHIVAAALANATDEKHLPLTGSGWADTTRVAAGSPEIWQDILQENRAEILTALEKFGAQVDAFREALKANETDGNGAIHQLLELGKKRRDAVGN